MSAIIASPGLLAGSHGSAGSVGGPVVHSVKLSIPSPSQSNAPTGLAGFAAKNAQISAPPLITSSHVGSATVTLKFA